MVNHNKEIVDDFLKWAEAQEDTSIESDIFKSLVEGTISYRDYLKKFNKLVIEYCEVKGFVAGRGLMDALYAKLRNNVLDNDMSNSVFNLRAQVDTMATINIIEEDEDDFI